MSTPTQKCDSGLAHDSHEKQCGGWCSVKEATHHCTWCKCAACDYCRPRESVTHVYASAGAGKAVCAESAAVAYPPSAEGSADDASLSQCKRACDAAAPACASFGFSAAAGGGGGLCRLRAAAGEPKKFCKRGDWVSYWRVDLRDADDDDDGLDGWLDVDVGPSGGARRALVRGRQLIDSATGAALHLHGVNIYVDYMRFDDMGLLSHLLPQANLVRLVGVFWHDDDACACCTDDAARGCDAAPFQPLVRAPATLSPPTPPTANTAHRALTPQVLCAVVPRRAPRRRAHGDRPRRLGDRRREGEDRRRRPLGERRARRLLRRKSRAQVPRALGVPRARAAR